MRRDLNFGTLRPMRCLAVSPGTRSLWTEEERKKVRR